MSGHSKKMLGPSTNPSKKEEKYCGKCPKCNEEAEATKTELLNQASSSDSSSMKKGNTPKDKKSSASSSISKSKSTISLLGHACEALSITAGSLSPNKSTGQVFIHAIRHAQSEHNNYYTSSEARKSILDPILTSRGRTQAHSTLGKHFDLSKATIFLSSPMHRCIQTLVIAFLPHISAKNLKVIAMPDLREWGNRPCNTGTKMSELVKKFPGLEDHIETKLAPDGWEVNTEHNDQDHRQSRSLRVRKQLYELSQILLQGGKAMWNGIEVKGVKMGKDVHIVVVSHAGFLGTMQGRDGEGLYLNAQHRTFQFAMEQMIQNSFARHSVYETDESINRKYVQTK